MNIRCKNLRHACSSRAFRTLFIAVVLCLFESQLQTSHFLNSEIPTNDSSHVEDSRHYLVHHKTLAYARSVHVVRCKLAPPSVNSLFSRTHATLTKRDNLKLQKSIASLVEQTSPFFAKYTNERSMSVVVMLI